MVPAIIIGAVLGVLVAVGVIIGFSSLLFRAGVARFAGYPLRGLVIKRVRWNGKEFKEIN